jgi:hypothetical protein
VEEEGDGFDEKREEDGGVMLSTEEGGKYEFDVGWD